MNKTKTGTFVYRMKYELPEKSSLLGEIRSHISNRSNVALIFPETNPMIFTRYASLWEKSLGVRMLIGGYKCIYTQYI